MNPIYLAKLVKWVPKGIKAIVKPEHGSKLPGIIYYLLKH